MLKRVVSSSFGRLQKIYKKKTDQINVDENYLFHFFLKYVTLLLYYQAKHLGIR